MIHIACIHWLVGASVGGLVCICALYKFETPPRLNAEEGTARSHVFDRRTHCWKLWKPTHMPQSC